ncbi:MAG: hypothetical protein IPO08_22670 [Xanthomonadales bacterium]|nr:hypothetical protein [Xanthomonadales bacterium]
MNFMEWYKAVDAAIRSSQTGLTAADFNAPYELWFNTQAKVDQAAVMALALPRNDNIRSRVVKVEPPAVMVQSLPVRARVQSKISPIAPPSWSSRWWLTSRRSLVWC